MSGLTTNPLPWTGKSFVPTLHHDVPPTLHPEEQPLPQPFVAVITGASRGIGKATAISFAQAGATGLILTARTVESLEETRAECKAVAKADLNITVLAADNAKEASATLVAQTIVKNYGGRLDLLVNNAGIISTDASAFERVGKINASQVQTTIDINFLGRFYMIKHLLPFLSSQKGSAQAIINIGSISAHVPGPLGLSISSLATNRLSERVADEYADDGIVCYAVHPGEVFPEQPPPGFPADFKDFSNDSAYLCGAFLLWLVKEKREWLSGRYLDATWDVTELEERKKEIVEGDKLKMRMVV